MHTVGLTDAAGKRVKQYSQGMRQRLGIALALVGDPELLTLDEPTNGLDPSGMREIRELLRRLADGGTTIFISSHLLAEVEAMCDRVGVMARGRLVAEGPPGTLRGTTDRIRITVDDADAARAVLARWPDVSVAPARPGSGIIDVTLVRRVGSGRRERRPRARRDPRPCARTPARHAWKTSSSISSRASMYRVELSKQVRRWRTWLLAAALAGIPVLVVVAVRLSPPPPQNSQDAPPFLLQIVRNGLFAPLTGLALVQPFFMSVAIGLFAGDAIAGEAQTGTLRYLLLRPVRRPRLIMSKYGAAMTFTGALLVIVICSGLLAGGVVFGIHPMPTLSGTSLSVVDGLVRIFASGAFILLAASGIVAVGMWISTLTDSGPGAIVATVIVAIASQIADQIPSLHAIQPFLPTHGWLGYTGLFRFPVDLATMRGGLIVSAAYTAVFLTLAVWRLRRRDITA